MNREQIFSALFAIVSAPPIFVTTGRRLMMWSAVSAQPALFMRPSKEVVMPLEGFGQPPRIILTVECWIYCQNGDPTQPSSTVLTNLLDTLDQALIPDSYDGHLTLGGLVQHCWREGETIIATGEPQTQSVAIVPIDILAIGPFTPATNEAQGAPGSPP